MGRDQQAGAFRVPYLDSQGALGVAVVVGVSLEALTKAFITSTTVGARGDEVVVASGCGGELEEVHHTNIGVVVHGSHVSRDGLTRERQVLVNNNAEAVLLVDLGDLVNVAGLLSEVIHGTRSVRWRVSWVESTGEVLGVDDEEKIALVKARLNVEVRGLASGVVGSVEHIRVSGEPSSHACILAIRKAVDLAIANVAHREVIVITRSGESGAVTVVSNHTLHHAISSVHS